MTFNPHEGGPFPRLLTERLWVLGNYFFNLYFVQGETASALIEVGVSAVVDDVMTQMKENVLHPSFLVVTHPHVDHVTGLEGLMERYPQALVVAAEGAAEFLTHPKTAESCVTEDAHMTRGLESYGIKSARPPVQEPTSLSNCLIAHDGDEMDLGGLTLRFLTAKGHSPGSLVVHVPEIEALMVSDSLGFRYPGRGVLPLFFTNYADYIENLERMRSLKPSIVGPAHQGPLVGQAAAEALEESLKEAVSFRNRIRNDARDTEEIACELFEKYYRDELTLYTEENIRSSVRLVVKRAKE